MTSGVLFVAIQISWMMLSAALVVVLVRLVRGPSGPDRVIALDLTATLVVGIIAVDAIANDQPVILDAAIIVSLVAFLGTVAFARYVEKGGRR
jgi:multicomponent Na+:H+ antiporter subunit F